MAGVSDTAENLMLDWITVTGNPTRPAGFYLALYTTNPNFETGSGSGSTSNTALLEWTQGTDIAAGTYTGFGIYSASSSGTFIGGAAFSQSRTLAATGDKISFAIGAVVLTQD
jgi:hypothetical protein